MTKPYAPGGGGTLRNQSISETLRPLYKYLILHFQCPTHKQTNPPPPPPSLYFSLSSPVFVLISSLNSHGSSMASRFPSRNDQPFSRHRHCRSRRSPLLLPEARPWRWNDLCHFQSLSSALYYWLCSSVHLQPAKPCLDPSRLSFHGNFFLPSNCLMFWPWEFFSLLLFQHLICQFLLDFRLVFLKKLYSKSTRWVLLGSTTIQYNRSLWKNFKLKNTLDLWILVVA